MQTGERDACAMWYRATGSSSTPQQPLAHVREEERRGAPQAEQQQEEEEEEQQQQQEEQAELEIAISEIARRGAGAGAASELAWLQEQGYTAEQIAALISHFEALPAGGSKEPGGPLLGLGSEQVPPHTHTHTHTHSHTAHPRAPGLTL